MTKKHRFKFDKLVRDRTIERLEARGAYCVYRFMETEEFLVRLKEKLLEEAHEVILAQNKQDYCAELADLLEVIHAFAGAVGLSMNEIEEKRLATLKERGGFQKRIFQESVEVPADNDLMNYYRNDPDKYLEVE
jgi:predicted house-cleaning noncanonical NTP pyrophosphatase (MazG superfamily)